MQSLQGSQLAQIFWVSEDCITVHESRTNKTVTAQSTCHWVGNNVYYVTCFVLHLNRSKSLTIGEQSCSNWSNYHNFFPNKCHHLLTYLVITSGNYNWLTLNFFILSYFLFQVFLCLLSYYWTEVDFLRYNSLYFFNLFINS